MKSIADYRPLVMQLQTTISGIYVDVLDYVLKMVVESEGEPPVGSIGMDKDLYSSISNLRESLRDYDHNLL